jgi:adenylate cyclase
MFTDVVGYTSLSQRDEKVALESLERHRELIRPIFPSHHGREVKTMGDAFLVQFDSALEAVECAAAMQRAIQDEPDSAKLQMKVGIHVGDVVQSGQDVFGDAVNIASRIEPLAKGGEVCISQQVYDQVRNKVPYRFIKLTPHELKNVMVPIDVYKVELPWQGAMEAGKAERLPSDRIAVLPFVNISPDPNDEFFADGLTEELIAGLALVKGLKVIARTSVMNYKKKEKNVSEIGRELGVGTIVEGSVRKAGNRIRVTVQMIDVNTEEHLWASSYENTLDDVFAVQRDIATKVAGSLPSSIPGTKAPVGLAKETSDVEAYLAFLQGEALKYKREEGSIRQALGFFKHAVERDPDFARAYTGIARCYMTMADLGLIHWTKAIDSAKEAAHRAMTIAPDLAEGHMIIAELAFMGDEPLELQQKEVDKALELNPNLVEAHAVLGQICALRGDRAGWVYHSETGYRLDPLSPVAIRRLGAAYFLTGRTDEAYAHWQKTLALDPINSYRYLTDYYVSKGDLAQAELMVSELERIAPTSEYTYLNKGYIAARKGDTKTAMDMIAKLDSVHEQGWARASSAGYIYLALGDVDKFFDIMIRAAKDHTLPAVQLLYSPLVAEIRRDDRFKSLFTEAGYDIPVVFTG